MAGPRHDCVLTSLYVAGGGLGSLGGVMALVQRLLLPSGCRCPSITGDTRSVDQHYRAGLRRCPCRLRRTTLAWTSSDHSSGPRLWPPYWVLGHGPYTWAGMDVIMRAPVMVLPRLSYLTPLAVGIGAALGAEPSTSHWMLATSGLLDAFHVASSGWLVRSAVGLPVTIWPRPMSAAMPSPASRSSGHSSVVSLPIVSREPCGVVRAFVPKPPPSHSWYNWHHTEYHRREDSDRCRRRSPRLAPAGQRHNSDRSAAVSGRAARLQVARAPSRLAPLSRGVPDSVRVSLLQ